MGWTYSHRDQGTSTKDFIQQDFDPGTQFHAYGTVGGVFYAAVETPRSPGKVWALVVLTDWDSKDYHNFGFKDMSESMGPFECRAPLSVLQALSPTDDETALEWREQVAQHHAQRKALRGLQDGDQVVLGAALRFTSGCERDTFTVRRQPTRGGRTRAVLTDGGRQAFRVPNWQDMTVAVVRDGERIETPLALKRGENKYVDALTTFQHCASDEERDVLKERYGGVGRFSDLRWAAREEFRRGDLFAPALADA